MAGVTESRQVSYARAYACIDRQALTNNAAMVRRLAGDASICAVVKADAYGHGVSHVVPALAPLVNSFAVATLDEGAEVRALAPAHDVIVLSEFNHPAQVAVLEEQRLQPVIHQPEQVRWILDHGGMRLKCWLKIDSGMSRLGIGRADLDELLSLLSQHCDERPGLMSHFACADSPDDPMNAAQLEAFNALTSSYDLQRSMANSAALAGLPEARFDMVRTGLLLYGISPYGVPEGDLAGLRPAMEFRARIIAVKHLPAGARVGYGATWFARDDRRIAIVSAGYADGYPRRLGNIGQVLANGIPADVIGMVSMDTMVIDVSQCGQVGLGDEVELWGSGLRVETVARWADTIPYELISQLGRRVPRLGISE